MRNPASRAPDPPLSLRRASFSRDSGGHDRDHGHDGDRDHGGDRDRGHDNGHNDRRTRRDDASRGPRHPPTRPGHEDGSSSNRRPRMPRAEESATAPRQAMAASGAANLIIATTSCGLLMRGASPLVR
jgi:hypothetical protein